MILYYLHENDILKFNSSRKNEDMKIKYECSYNLKKRFGNKSNPTNIRCHLNHFDKQFLLNEIKHGHSLTIKDEYKPLNDFNGLAITFVEIHLHNVKRKYELQ